MLSSRPVETLPRFGRYHVLGPIARGGMAEVFRVKTVGIAGFEKVQALKRIAPAQSQEPRFIRSFIDEARIAAELTHKNVVQVFDFGEVDGVLYLTMELIDGCDLRTALARARRAHLPLPGDLAAHVIAELGTGLDYAHRKADAAGRPLGIVHCDVSPPNVMISTEGHVKILDFGVARASFAHAVERRRLRGKPRYMAPEQTRGERPTPATDVFALALVAWELLTDAPLFDGADVASTLAAVRSMPVPPIDRVRPDVPMVLARALERALVRNPDHRISALELARAAAVAAGGAGARALAAWLDQVHEALAEPTAPVPPRVPVLAESTVDTVTREPAAVAGAVAVVLNPSPTERWRKTPPPPPKPGAGAPKRDTHVDTTAVAELDWIEHTSADAGFAWIEDETTVGADGLDPWEFADIPTTNTDASELADATIDQAMSDERAIQPPPTTRSPS